MTTSATRKRSLPRSVRRLAGPAFILAVWWLVSIGPGRDGELAPPDVVLVTGWRLILNGQLPEAIVVSLRRVLEGLLLGGGVGIALALLAGLSRRGEDVIDAAVQMIRTLPFVGLVPLFIVWFGIEDTPKIALVALGVAFPIYINVFAGVRNVDAGLVETGQTLGLSQAELLREVILPGALPNALVGLRYALGTAWLALIFAEQINAKQGIGQLMFNAQEYQRTDIIIVCLVVYALLGLLADLSARLFERRLLAWRPAFSGA